MAIDRNGMLLISPLSRLLESSWATWRCFSSILVSKERLLPFGTSLPTPQNCCKQPHGISPRSINLVSHPTRDPTGRTGQLPRGSRWRVAVVQEQNRKADRAKSATEICERAGYEAGTL